MKFRILAVFLAASLFIFSHARGEDRIDLKNENEPTPKADVETGYVSSENKAESKVDISSFSLEDLLKEEYSVATSKATTIRETPAIVTVISKDDIKRMGFRDLLDILRFVQGFEPALDVWGTVGMGFRGQWAYEGKLLVLLDGHSLVERSYTNVPLGNRISVDQIERVEIIRGPGSVIYGREAELGVINIVTKIGGEFSGVSGSYHSGYFNNAVARQNMHLSAGHHFNEDIYLGATIFKGYGQRTSRWYTDIYGDSINLDGNSSLNPSNMLVNLRLHGLEVEFFSEDYKNISRDGYDSILDRKLDFLFSTKAVIASYKIKLRENLVLIPKFKYSRQKPWNARVDRDETSEFYIDTTSDRYTGEIKLDWDPWKNINLVFGSQYDYDKASYGPLFTGTFAGGTTEISYHNFALYSEIAAKTWLANPTLGVRYEHHNVSGNSIVPRVGLTKVINDFHAKFMYNMAFRTPSIEQFNGADNVGVELKSEKTQIIEVEAGYAWRNLVFVSANFFDILIKDPIGYEYDTVNDLDTYRNFDKVGTRGFETELKMLGDKGFATLSYSFYAKTRDASGQFYTDPLNDNRFLAFPQHKIALWGSYKIWRGLNISPSMTLVTSRAGYTSQDTVTGDPIASEIGPDVLFNLYFLYEDAFIKGLNFGFGVFDIFEQKPPFIQPYNGYHSPIPGNGREFIFKITYEWDAPKKG